MSESASGVKMLGLEEINAALEQFEHKTRKKVLKKAMTNVAADIRKRVRKATPKGETGNLRKSVTSGSRILRKKETIWGGVWYSVKGNKKGYHANWIEYGTGERFVENYRGNEGVEVSVGAITGERLITKVYKRSMGKQVRTFEQFLKKHIDKVKSVN